MTLRTLDRAGLRAVYKTHVKRDFPPSERKPLFVMERLAREGRYVPLGVYEGEELLAYAFLWHDGAEDYVLLDYLAVVEGRRGRGTGSAVLRLLEEHCRNYRGILVEAEALSADADPEENARRTRRQEFYLRAGFRKLSYQAKLFGVVYDMFSSGEADSQAAAAAHRRLYAGGGHPRPGHFLEIPYTALPHFNPTHPEKS